jgi:hypothetical protein
MNKKYNYHKLNTLISVILLLTLSFLSVKSYTQSEKSAGFQMVEISDNSVTLTYQDTLTLPSYTAFDLPVKMLTGHEISALTIGLYYESEYIEIDSVILDKKFFGFYYNITDSLFLIVWSNTNPVTISDNDTLLTFKMRSMDLSGMEGTTKLDLKESSEFADPLANIIQGVILETAEIEYLEPEPPDTITGFSLRVYPNPFNDFTTIDFNLKIESQVKLTLFNPDGMEVRSWEETTYPKGNHQVRLYASDYPQGIYLLKFEIRNSDGEGTKLIKIISAL